MKISLLVRSDLAEKIIQTCNFQTAIIKKRPPSQMSTQAFFEANTLYLSNLKRNRVPLSCTQTPLQPLDYIPYNRNKNHQPREQDLDISIISNALKGGGATSSRASDHNMYTVSPHPTCFSCQVGPQLNMHTYTVYI